jgi:hypothetical protein
MPTASLPNTRRTKVHRLSEYQVFDREALNGVLDAGMVAHLTADLHGVPVALPMGYGRDGDRLVIHGSTGAGLLRAAVSGAPVSVTVTHVDGLVFARSLFEASINYRCAVVFGIPERLEGADKLRGLRALADHLMPGRWDELPPPTRRELAATLVFAVDLTTASVKIRTGGPTDTAADNPEAWAGVLPLRLAHGAPEVEADVDTGVPVPQSLLRAAAGLPSYVAEPPTAPPPGDGEPTEDAELGDRR